MDDWVRPANLIDAWSGASVMRRRWATAAVCVFAVGIVIWIARWFVPEHLLPGGWWLTVLGWVPAVGFIAVGLASTALMTGLVSRAKKPASLSVVTNWAETVHRLTKESLDSFQSQAAHISPAAVIHESRAGDLNDAMDQLAVAENTSVEEIVESIGAIDPRWQPPLLRALREIVELERSVLPKQSYSQRLSAASPAVHRRARWGPAFLALALVAIFAAPLGMIVLGLCGLQPEASAHSGAFVGPAGGAIIAWVGIQLTAVPDTRRSELLAGIANSLGATSEQLS